MELNSIGTNARPALSFAAIGALGFWAPDLIVHAWARHTFDSPHVWAITFLMPTALLIAYLMSRKRARVSGFRWVGIAMMIGVWLTGGLFIMLCSTVQGAGFATAGVFPSILIVIGSVVPIVTFILATYDGSLAALLIVTGVATLIWSYEASRLRKAISHRGKMIL